ncbi:hypothetical protein Q428_14415 [Fervidicella metallireducens AeB]|uniref:Uncharacterized protein n=1 Tax=Fervidicella metallireducens AeB TaxID=1403537 RepID=A0A017RTK6_9CLOT|nr:hypothetical protein [Fervidicella metallireducens]EYE87235.1 hypothetical protein Q428_14415 [Fervidicella metallireducens AeB]
MKSKNVKWSTICPYINIVIFIFLVMMGKTLPRYLTFLIVLVLTIIFVIEYIKDRKNKNNTTQSYVYISGFMFIALFILVLVVNMFFVWDIKIQLYLLACSLIPGVYFIVMRIILMLKSGDEEQIGRAKLAVFMSIILALIIIFIIIGAIITL